MKWLAAALLAVVILLQYRVWFSENGVHEVERLRRAVATQRADNEQLAERNRQLAAEVRDLKTGMDALEERTVIEWALAPFLADARCAHIVVALAPHDAAWKPIAARLGAAAGPSA